MTIWENFSYATQALAQSISLNISYFWLHPFFWGFGLGFLIATVVSALIIMQNPVRFCSEILRSEGKKQSRKVKRLSKLGKGRQDYLGVVKDSMWNLFWMVILVFLLIVLLSLILFAIP